MKTKLFSKKHIQIGVSQIIFFIFFVFCGFTFSQPLPGEAKAAFEYLNLIRENPGIFSKEIGVDLKKANKLPPLIWNDTLAIVALQKAEDMAKRGYFAHLNPEGEGINILIHKAGYFLPPEWTKDKKANFFESLNAGTKTGKGAIADLILDSYDSSKGHRKHLLGLNEFYRNLTDIGIGHIHSDGSKFGYYTVVIIAKHK